MLPWICAIAWAIGAVAARRYGVWIALGTTGLVLGVLCVIARGAQLVALRHSGAILGIVGGIAMTLATYALYPPIARAWPMFFHDANALYGAFTTLQPWLAVALLVPIIASEEVVWRGVMQSALMDELGATKGALACAVVYALAHAPTGSPVLAIAALGCGLVWSALRLTTGGLIAPLAAHLIWDFAVLLVHPIVPKPL